MTCILSTISITSLEQVIKRSLITSTKRNSFVQQQQKPFPFVSAITRGEREKTHPINMLRFFVVSSNAKNTLDRGEHLKHFLVIFNQRVVYFFTISSHSNRSNGVLRQTRSFFFVFEEERNGKQTFLPFDVIFIADRLVSIGFSMKTIRNGDI